MGKVVELEPAPAVKKAIINSSTDNVNASNDPAKTPGNIIGNVILMKVTIFFPPKS